MASTLSGYRAFYMTIRVRDEASRGAQNISRALGAMEDSAEALRQRMMGVGRGLMSMGTGMIAAGATGAGVLSSFTNEAMKFGQQTAYAFTQVDEVGTSLEQLRGIAKNVAREVPLPLEQMSEGLYDIFSTIDISMADSEEVLTGFAKAALAGNTSVRTSARSAISVMNAYELQTADLGAVLDWQFQLVRKGAGTYDDFARTIGLALPSFRAADQTIETLGGSIAFLTRRGLSASRAATSAARAMELMAQPRAVENLEKMGIVVREADGSFRQINEIVTDLAEGPFKDLVGPDFRDMFKKIFGSGRIQARRFFDITLKNQHEYNEMVGDFIDNADAMEYAYDIMYNEPIMRSQELRIHLDLLKQEIGERLIPTFEWLIARTENLLDLWDRLPGFIKTIIVAFAALTSAILLFGGAVMFGSGALLLFYAALKPWKGAMAKLRNAWIYMGTFTTRIGLLFLWIGNSFKSLWGIFKSLPKILGGFVRIASNIFLMVFGSAIRIVIGLLVRFAAILGAAAAGLAAFLGLPIWATVLLVLAVVAAVVSLVYWWDEVVAALKIAWFWSAAFADKLWDGVVEAVYAVGRAFKADWFGAMSKIDAVWEGIKKKLIGYWDWIAKQGTKFGDILVNDVWVPVWNFVQEKTTEIWLDIMHSLETIWNDINVAIEVALNWVKELAVEIWDGIYEYLKEIWKDYILKYFKEKFLVPLIEEWDLAFVEMQNKIAPAWQIILDELNTAWGTIKDAFVGAGGAWSDFWSGEPTYPDKVLEDAEETKGAWDSIKAAWFATWNAIKWMWWNVFWPAMKWAGSKSWSLMKTAWEGIKTAWRITWGALKWMWWNWFWPGMKWVGSTGWSLMKGAWEGVKAAWGVTWDGMKWAWREGVWPALKWVGSTSWEGMKGAWDDIKWVWNNKWDLMKGAWEGLLTGIKWVGSTSWEEMKGAWEEIKWAWNIVWDGMKVAAGTMWDKFLDEAGTIWDWVNTGWQFICDGIVWAWGLAWDRLKPHAESGWDKVREYPVATIWAWVNTGWQFICDGIGWAWSLTWNGLKPGAEIGWNDFKDWCTALWEWLGLDWHVFTNRIESAWDAAWDNLAIAADVVFSAINLALALFVGDWEQAKIEILEIASHVRAWAILWFRGAGLWLYQPGKDLLTGLWDGMKEIWADIEAWANGLNFYDLLPDLDWRSRIPDLSFLSNASDGSGGTSMIGGGGPQLEVVIPDFPYEDIAAGGGTQGLSQMVEGLGGNTAAMAQLTQAINLAESLGTPLNEGALTRNEVAGWVSSIQDAVDPAAMAGIISQNIIDYRIGENAFESVGWFQHGGIVTSPGLYGLGEAGAEAIIPLNNPEDAMSVMDAAGLGGTGNITVNVYGNPDEDEITFAKRVALAVGEEVFANGY
tara:strand:- start:1826 stop:5977 length:4152 start_codon:yes stop_codon:yes gene_type:complete